MFGLSASVNSLFLPSHLFPVFEGRLATPGILPEHLNRGHITRFLSLRPPIPILAVLTDIFIAGRVSATSFPLWSLHTVSLALSNSKSLNSVGSTDERDPTLSVFVEYFTS